MARMTGKDLRLTESGDLAIENGDLAIVQKQAYIAQSARNRFKTSDPDWIDYQVTDIGANLEDLLGMPNNPETAKLGAEKIGHCLTRDGLAEEDDIYIKPIPINRYTISFFVFINVPESSDPIGFELLFNLETGLVTRSA